MVRDQFIEAVREQFGERLIRKKNKRMDSYYLDKVRKGRGIFWIDYEESGTKGYRVHLQKIKGVTDEIPETGYGEYPLVFLSEYSEIKDILRKVGDIISHMDGKVNDRGAFAVDQSPSKDVRLKGIVTPKKCDQCGHHEIGITTEKGDYLPLKPGMKVEVIGE
jgi:hypothetical protein